MPSRSRTQKTHLVQNIMSSAELTTCLSQLIQGSLVLGVQLCGSLLTPADLPPTLLELQARETAQCWYEWTPPPPPLSLPLHTWWPISPVSPVLPVLLLTVASSSLCFSSSYGWGGERLVGKGVTMHLPVGTPAHGLPVCVER